MINGIHVIYCVNSPKVVKQRINNRIDKLTTQGIKLHIGCSKVLNLIAQLSKVFVALCAV